MSRFSILRNPSKHPLYDIYSAMLYRCTSPKSPSWANYGGRGITVCQRWVDSFDDFLADMGDRPSDDHSLERVDNNGPYSPANVVWATAKQQSRNRRNNRMIKFNGELKCLAQWAEDTGIAVATILMRIRLGWPMDLVLETPARFISPADDTVHDIVPHPRKKNLVGMRFGKLKVVEELPLKGKSPNTRWKLECDCGGTKEAHSHNLKAGRTKTCGGCEPKGPPRKSKLTYTPSQPPV